MRKPIAVIIAEDKIPFRETLAASLEDYGISVIAQAGNGLELLAHLKIREPDIILLDLRMPEMDGSETMNQLANEHPQIKVIILSYHDSPMVQDDYAKRGAKGYVCKDELVGDIRG
ncbi:MAG: response regulator transcription factor, partial [Bacteroidia bacterium]|nr:response regulator transcription factor [Bacteroidia bacterium]